MCSNGRSTGNITDIESLFSDKRVDINLENVNIEKYKKFEYELFQFNQEKHETMKK